MYLWNATCKKLSMTSFYYNHLGNFSHYRFLGSTPGILTDVWMWSSGFSTSKSFFRWFWHNLFPAWYLGPTFIWPWLQKAMMEIGNVLVLRPFQDERKWTYHLPRDPKIISDLNTSNPRVCLCQLDLTSTWVHTTDLPVTETFPP